MKSIVKYLIILVLVLLALLLGVFWGGRMDFFKEQKIESSSVMLEKVAKVFKLIAVEAQVSEIYNYEDYKRWDISPLRKRALLRINAKVSIGYNFENMEFLSDEKTHTITIKDFPDPEILSIDHDVDYFDMEEGLFNSFTGSDLSLLNARAKEYAQKMVMSTEVYRQADEQKNEILLLLKEIFSSSGWELIIDDTKAGFAG